MDEQPIIDMMATIPEFWAHTHRYDASASAYDGRMIDQCDICRERFLTAVDANRACEKHPTSYYEPSLSHCEECQGAL